MAKEVANSRARTKPRGRPAKNVIPSMSAEWRAKATAQSIWLACCQGPPKKNWDYLKKK